MSRSNKKLKGAFSIPLSEPKWKTALRDRKAAAAEKMISKVERKVHEDTQRRVEAAEQRAAAALQAKADRAQAQRQQKLAAEQKRRELAADRQACTCRKPNLDDSGKCRRCKKFRGVSRRGRK